MADETTPTTPSTPSASPVGFFSKPPQRPGVAPPIRPAAPPPPMPTPDPTETQTLGSTEPHPWMRYFARMADIMLFSLASGIALGLIAPVVVKNVNGLVLGILIVFTWVFVETALLVTWGTTPGKWLLGVTLRARGGGGLDGNAAFSRSFAVWLRGLGLGLPIVCLVTLVKAYNRLKQAGETSWDAEGGFEVAHRPLGGGRLAILIVIGVLFVVFALIGALAS